MRFADRRSLSLLAALMLLGTVACNEPQPAGSPPPAGMAGVTPPAAPAPSPAKTAPVPAATPQQPVAPTSQPAGFGAGVNPHAAASASQPSTPGAQPPGHPPMGKGQPASQPARPTIVKGTGQSDESAQANKRFMGKVAETFNSAGYTYMRVQTADSGDVWAAVMETSVAIGSTVSLTESLTMHDFHSKSLNRTFDKIVFATLNAK